MKLLSFLKNYRFWLFGLLLFLLGLLILLSIFFKERSQPPATFITSLLVGITIFNFLVLLMAILGISESMKIVSLLKKMLSFTEKIKKGNFSEKIFVERKDELGKLARNLDLMRISLKKSFFELKKEKERFQKIIESVGEGLLVINKERKITLANSSAERILGFSKKELLNRKYFKILKFLDRKKGKFICRSANEKNCPIEKAFLKKQQIDIPSDIAIVDKYGRKIDIEGNIAPFYMKDSIASFVFSFYDVTTEREIERMKSEFISITSHQLRTPLSSIRWYVEMLLGEDAGSLKPTQRTFLEDVHESTLTAINLINNLLDVQRIEAGRLIIEKEKVNLEKILEEVLRQLTPLALASNTKFVKKIEKIPLVRLDKKKVSQIFSNIISNAIVYNVGRGDILIKLEKRKKRVVFSCKDKGIGIPKNEQKNIFKKFFRASNTAGIGTPGTGIGLYICKIYTEKMGGKIWFYSEGKNKGATFYVSFPISK